MCQTRDFMKKSALCECLDSTPTQLEHRVPVAKAQRRPFSPERVAGGLACRAALRRNCFLRFTLQERRGTGHFQGALANEAWFGGKAPIAKACRFVTIRDVIFI
jgi:hypothetical protein